MEAFAKSHEVIVRVQVDKLTKEKREYIMSFNHRQMLLITHVNSPIFRAKSNGSICKIPQSHREGPGGQVDQEEEGVHHVL